MPQSYLIHEHMVITDRIKNVDHLGFFIYRLCHDKETYKLQRRDTIKGNNFLKCCQKSFLFHFIVLS